MKNIVMMKNGNSKLPWVDNLLLISKIKDKTIREIYANEIIKNGWRRNMLAL